MPELKRIMAGHPLDFLSQIQHLCLKAGLKVIVTPNPAQAPINGEVQSYLRLRPGGV